MKLSELRPKLEAQIREGQLPEALNALLAQLPEGSETYRIVSALITRLNAANKERYRNTISTEEYQRRVDQISADFFDLLSELTEADFLPAVAEASSGKTDKSGKIGSVLYRVPHVMPIQKPTRCTVRVAVDEDAIIGNIVLDEHVEIKSRVEISDVMSAELVDPEGGTFLINPMNKHTQLVKDTGYTEWNFNVTPLVEGVHQLLVKVSIMEVVPGFSEPIPREVSLMETVTIVTEGSFVEVMAQAGAAPASGEFKPSGQSFAFQSTATAQGNYEINYSKSIEPPSEPPSPSVSKSSNRGLRAAALFLAFLVIVPAATFAIAPDFPAYVVAIVQDTPEAYADFIENHPNSPRLEKAYFYRAEASGRLADLRLYQEKFQNSGKYESRVLGKIAALETKSLESIRERPDSLKIRQFVAEFPESERLAEVKQAVENRQETRTELLAEVESAYVRSVKSKPTETKVVAYLRDFPKQNRLNEVDAAARSKPEVYQKVQPMLEDAYLKKMEENPTQEQSEQFIQKFPEPARREKFEKILEKKPGLKREAVRKMQKIEEAKKLREDDRSSSAGDDQPSSNNPSRPRKSGIHDMVFVEGGDFELSKNAGLPSKTVNVPSFWIGTYEVTQADWKKIMGQYPENLYNLGCDDCPVEGVSWNEIQDFLKRLNILYPNKNYRLPTEAEWEYAARGGAKSVGYQYAGGNDLDDVGWYFDNYRLGQEFGKNKATQPVGQKKANELGIYDMSGNVYEWCQGKWYDGMLKDLFNRVESKDSLQMDNRVLRGGTFGVRADECREAVSFPRDRNYKSLLGFRLAR